MQPPVIRYDDPFQRRDKSETRLLIAAGVFAVLIHLGILLVPLPSAEEPPPIVIKEPRLHLQVAHLPPPPRPARPNPPTLNLRRRPWLESTVALSTRPVRERAQVIDEDSELDWDRDLEDVLLVAPEAPWPAGPIPMETPGLVHPVPILEGRMTPEYPRLAVHARREATVVLLAVIDENGSVTELELLSVTALRLGFEEAASAAVRRWRYQPARYEGRPVAVRMMVTVDFILED